MRALELRIGDRDLGSYKFDRSEWGKEVELHSVRSREYSLLLSVDLGNSIILNFVIRRFAMTSIIRSMEKWNGE